MPAIEPGNYWQPVCDVVTQLRCWVRLAQDGDFALYVTPWSQLLTIPVAGYLESGGGPASIQSVTWVQIIPIKVRGGLAGRPLEFVNYQDGAVAAIRETQAVWTLREELWSVPNVFDARPALAIHVANPFRAGT